MIKSLCLSQYRLSPKSWILSVISVFAVSACSDNLVTADPRLTEDPFWSVELNIHRATMSTVAPYNTLQLTATPRRASGAVLTGNWQTTFTAGDSTLIVDTNGLVTVLETSSRSYVVARIRQDSTNIEKFDTLVVTTTNLSAPRRLATFQLPRTVGDTLNLPIDSTRRLTVIAKDSTGRSFTAIQLPTWYLSRNVAYATTERENGTTAGVAPGRTVTLTASTTYYGITMIDSVVVAVKYPFYVQIGLSLPEEASFTSVFGTAPITIAAGGTVFFQPFFFGKTDNSGSFITRSVPYSVQFDDPSVALPSPMANGVFIPSEGGNVEEITLPIGNLNEIIPQCYTGALRCFAARSFAEPGTYKFRDPRSGNTGTIIVK